MADHAGGLPPRPTVLIVDDHKLFSTSLRMALRAEGVDAHQTEVIGYEEILGWVGRLAPDLVVLDLELGADPMDRAMHGSNLVRDIRAAGSTVLVVSGTPDQEAGVAAAITAGAVGSVPKASEFGVLVKAIRRVCAGEPVMSEAEHRGWLSRHRELQDQARELKRRFDRLSPREWEVVEMLSQGHRAAAIAEHFVVEVSTVRSQVRSILSKLEASSQLEVVALFKELPPHRRRR